jgi:hypothetical protein
MHVPCPLSDNLAQMCRKQLDHFKHGDLIFAKDRLELGVRVDIALICRVLKAVCLEVFPDFLGNFSAWDGRATNDGSPFRDGVSGLLKPVAGAAVFAAGAFLATGVVFAAGDFFAALAMACISG